MKVLIFEYITGGGFNKRVLPDTLAQEGMLMLQALLDNFSKLSDIKPIVMLDSRLTGRLCTEHIDVEIINPRHDSHEEFLRLATQCDAVWPIAPEFDEILKTLCQMITPSTLLLTSPASVVAITGNKWLTYQHLIKHHIATVSTQLLHYSDFYRGDWIIKALDGAGCSDSYLITDQQDFDNALNLAGKFIIQPHLQGKKTSLSCLFKQGTAWLLSVNLQRFNIINKQYQLVEIIVNHNQNQDLYQDLYQGLADDIARALPDLWGYVGIDLIETAEQTFVLEINPRLTTSFAGIYAALGINVAEQVLRLLKSAPDVKTIYNKSINIKINQ